MWLAHITRKLGLLSRVGHECGECTCYQLPFEVESKQPVMVVDRLSVVLKTSSCAGSGLTLTVTCQLRMNVAFLHRDIAARDSRSVGLLDGAAAEVHRRGRDAVRRAMSAVSGRTAATRETARPEADGAPRRAGSRPRRISTQRAVCALPMSSATRIRARGVRFVRVGREPNQSLRCRPSCMQTCTVRTSVPFEEAIHVSGSDLACVWKVAAYGSSS